MLKKFLGPIVAISVTLGFSPVVFSQEQDSEEMVEQMDPATMDSMMNADMADEGAPAPVVKAAAKKPTKPKNKKASKKERKSKKEKSSKKNAAKAKAKAKAKREAAKANKPKE